MNLCICCHTQLLHYLNGIKSYWFCTNCYQEMPGIIAKTKIANKQSQNYIRNIAVNKKG